MPRLEVEGAGALSFPVPETQIKDLIAVAERAPYGKGTATVLDRSVRDCWQIDARRVRLGGAGWKDTFERLLAAAADGLGCPRIGSTRSSTSCWSTSRAVSLHPTATPKRLAA